MRQQRCSCKCRQIRVFCLVLLAAAAIKGGAAGRVETLLGSSRSKISSIDHSTRFESPILHGGRYHNATVNANLGSWEQAVADLPLCKKGSWQAMASGNWYKDSQGEVFYEPSTCKLRRLTADAARACLANKTLTFIGGSLARYQYVNFAYFLAHRQHMQRYADDPWQPSLVIEKTWSNFSHYYTEGSKSLTWTDAAGTASEHCHCYRLKWFGGSYEHRLLTVNVTKANNKGLNATVRIIYNQTFGIKKDVATDTLEAIQWNLQDNPRPANYIVMNLGHWMHHGLKDKLANYTAASALYEPVFATATDDARKKTEFIWRTTTHARTPPFAPTHSTSNWNPIWHRMLNSLARFHRWDLYDGHAVTRAMMRSGLDGNWDNLHFLPFVYDQLNDVLLNGIC